MISAMKELLTKRFWQDVKKTFDDAKNTPPPQEDATLPTAAEGEAAQETPAEKEGHLPLKER
jgi:hypothetical protein